MDNFLLLKGDDGKNLGAINADHIRLVRCDRTNTPKYPDGYCSVYVGEMLSMTISAGAYDEFVSTLPMAKKIEK